MMSMYEDCEMLEQIKFNLYIGFTADGKCVCNSLDDNDDHFPCP